MKNYTITVNGNVYDVVVEEGASTGAPAAAPRAAVPKAAPVAAPKAAPKAPKAAGGAGSIKVEAGAAGKVFKIEAGVGIKHSSVVPQYLFYIICILLHNVFNFHLNPFIAHNHLSKNSCCCK